MKIEEDGNDTGAAPAFIARKNASKTTYDNVRALCGIPEKRHRAVEQEVRPWFVFLSSRKQQSSAANVGRVTAITQRAPTARIDDSHRYRQRVLHSERRLLWVDGPAKVEQRFTA